MDELFIRATAEANSSLFFVSGKNTTDTNFLMFLILHMNNFVHWSAFASIPTTRFVLRGLLCIPGSEGLTVACSTPSVPGEGRHRSSSRKQRGLSSKGANQVGHHDYTGDTCTNLSDQSKGPVKAPGISVLPHFVVEPTKFSQSAAGVSQRPAQHHLLSQNTHYNTYISA